MQSLIFVKAETKADAAAIADLAENIWKDHYSPIIGIRQVEYMLEKFQSADAIMRQISSEGLIYYLINESAARIGYVGYAIDKDCLFLSKFYILSSMRGKGYGKKSIEFIVKCARKHNCDKIKLTVNKHNSNTIGIYDKLGFEIIGSVEKDIGNGFLMDDYVMQKTI